MFYFLCLFLFTFECVAANENVVSALSSLKCYYEQKQEPSESDIPFEEEDLMLLWDKASLSQDSDVHRLRYRYELDPDDRDLERDITAVWDRLRVKDKKNKSKVKSQFLLPSNHPSKPALDAIFTASRATASVEAMYAAGFNKVYPQPYSFMCLAGHPNLPGILLKLYLDNETRLKDGLEGYVWLERRCQGALDIRNVISQKRIKYFTVPDKYLYRLPNQPAPMVGPGFNPQPYLLVVTDMNLVSPDESANAWKTKITKKHLDELYAILSQGLGSAYVGINVPFTRSGLFAFIDTEYPKREIKYRQAKEFLSPEMAKYWDKLVKKGGK